MYSERKPQVLVVYLTTYFQIIWFWNLLFKPKCKSIDDFEVILARKPFFPLLIKAMLQTNVLIRSKKYDSIYFEF